MNNYDGWKTYDPASDDREEYAKELWLEYNSISELMYDDVDLILYELLFGNTDEAKRMAEKCLNKAWESRNIDI